VQLLAIARMLLDRYEVQVVNAEIGIVRKSQAELERVVREHLDDCVLFGVSAMTGYGIRGALAMSRFVRRHAPRTKIVWGGWHASLLPEQTLQAPEIDFVVIGQGEDTTVQLLEAIESGMTDFSSIKGLGWKQDGVCVVNPRRQTRDINAFPPLPFHLLEDEAFYQRPGERTAAIITCVGCPFNCGFCADRAVYGGHWTPLTAARCLDELRRLHEEFGVTAVRILDSNFFADRKRSRSILEGMRAMGVRAVWVNARVDALLAATASEMELFRDTVNSFLVGAESGCEEMLELINKKQAVADVREVGRKYAAYKIPICFSTIVGLPHEDPAIRQRELGLTVGLIDDILKESRFLHTGQVHVYTPYPGTPLYANVLKLGFDPPQSLEGWADVEMWISNLPYAPADLGKQAEFISTFILQLLRPEYRFFRGTNPLAKAGFAAVQAILKGTSLIRWKLKYFDNPVEMWLAKKLLGRLD